MTHRRGLLAAGISLVLAAAGCHEDDLMSPPIPPYTGGAMFQRYVSMGNSITAGFQSAGIDSVTQLQSYAALVASAMGTPYYYPGLNWPGCPPLFTNIFTGARVAGGTSMTCLFRSPNIPPFLTNVAVPGAEVIDGISNFPTPGTNSNALTLLMLGGRTQTQAMMAAHPTFVSVWLGNNDLLGAAQAGDTTLATDTAAFRVQYSEVLDSIEATGAQGALLIAVGFGHLSNNVVPPHFSRGSTWFNVAASGAFAPAPFTVAANCASPGGDAVLVSFAYGFGVLLAQAQGGTPTTLDCTAPPVVQAVETAFFARLQAAYNATIQSQAAARGWAYTDSVNTTADSLAAIPGQFAPFPNIGNPPPDCSTNTFGLAFSCDGIHPSAATHRLIARKLVRAINQKYGSAIPAVP